MSEKEEKEGEEDSCFGHLNSGGKVRYAGFSTHG